jgi:hypothetical protein
MTTTYDKFNDLPFVYNGKAKMGSWKDKNNRKKLLTENLVTVMKSNSIDCFDINGGALIYKKNKVKSIKIEVPIRPVSARDSPQTV